MNVELPIGKTLVDFSLEMPFDPEAFAFNFHLASGLLWNADQIERQLRKADKLHHVRLIGHTPICIGRATFGLDCRLYFYPSATSVDWALKDLRHLPVRSLRTLNGWLAALEPVMIGTVQTRMVDLRAEVKQDIRDRARRLGNLMRENGDGIVGLVNDLDK